ncbi:MAG TPA: serine hydrolase domain-containing protein [Allosphingosinicella sp.]
MRFLFLSLLVLLAPAPLRADGIDDVVREQMAVSHIPGVAVAVVERGKTVKLRGYGEAMLEWPSPVDADTRFQLASATKLFTGVLLMRLVERKALSLDDPIAAFFDKAPADWQRITVRQLANHSSGLPDDLGTPGPKTVEAIVAAAMARPLAYRPGTEARYGFTDFVVLRAILEKVSGKPLPVLLRDEIAVPLGLRSTGFAMEKDDGMVRTGEVLPRRASIYGWRGRQTTDDFFFAPEGYGAGGLYSSAADLARFFDALDEGRLLKPQSVGILQTAGELAGGRKSGFGIGWTVRDYRGVPVAGHSGGPALSDILRVDSRGLTIIVLTNQRIFYPLLAERIADLYLPEPALPAIADKRPRLTAALAALFADAAAGRSDPSRGPSGADPAAPLLSDFGQALLTGVGPVERVELVAEQDGERTYRVVFERKTMMWKVAADGEDRIVALRPA